MLIVLMLPKHIPVELEVSAVTPSLTTIKKLLGDKNRLCFNKSLQLLQLSPCNGILPDMNHFQSVN